MLYVDCSLLQSYKIGAFNIQNMDEKSEGKERMRNILNFTQKQALMPRFELRHLQPRTLTLLFFESDICASLFSLDTIIWH